MVEQVRDVAAELLAEHDRLRRAALERHGLRVTAVRLPGTKAERDLLRAIGERRREYGEAVCLHVLAVLAADWNRDAEQCRKWSAHESVWSSAGFERHREREVGSVFGASRPTSAKRPSSLDVPSWEGVQPGKFGR